MKYFIRGKRLSWQIAKSMRKAQHFFYMYFLMIKLTCAFRVNIELNIQKDCEINTIIKRWRPLPKRAPFRLKTNNYLFAES